MAGARTPQALSEPQLHRLIRSAGRIPVERDSLYNVLEVHGGDAGSPSSAVAANA
jgi:aminodeoxyfutalosine synthase